MMRVEIDISVPGSPNRVLEVAEGVTSALVHGLSEDTVVHRVTVEEADA